MVFFAEAVQIKKGNNVKSPARVSVMRIVWNNEDLEK